MKIRSLTLKQCFANECFVIKNLIFLEIFKRHPLLICFNDNYHQFYHLVEKKGFVLQTNSESFNLKTKLNVEKMSCNCQRHQLDFGSTGKFWIPF